MKTPENDELLLLLSDPSVEIKIPSFPSFHESDAIYVNWAGQLPSHPPSVDMASTEVAPIEGNGVSEEPS